LGGLRLFINDGEKTLIKKLQGFGASRALPVRPWTTSSCPEVALWFRLSEQFAEPSASRSGSATKSERKTYGNSTQRKENSGVYRCVTKLPDGNFTPLLAGSLKGLLANANIYTKPSVDPDVLRERDHRVQELDSGVTRRKQNGQGADEKFALGRDQDVYRTCVLC
jgi:hypothetical protein